MMAQKEKTIQTDKNLWADLAAPVSDSQARSTSSGDEFSLRLKYYRRQIESDPENPRLWVQVGNLCKRYGHTRRMVTAFAKAISLFAMSGEQELAISLSKVLATTDMQDVQRKAVDNAKSDKTKVVRLY